MIVKKKKSRGFRPILFVLFLATLATTFYYWYSLNKNTNIKKIIHNELAVFCVGQERPDLCYWFDNNGLIGKRATTIVGDAVKIDEISNYQPKIDKLFIDQSLWGNFYTLINFFKAGKLNVSSIVLNRDEKEINVNTANGTNILFSLRFNPKNNINGLLVFKNKTGLANISQIDLRTENKIYYK